MPRPPRDIGFFDKINWVIDSWAEPCDAPWYIYIETMKPAALEAFITLITFGWDDVLRGFLRPKGLNRRRTSKRKGKWSKHIPRFPELGEEIGKKLPFSEKAKGIKWNDLGKTLWRIDGVLQQGLFWWLIVDVTNDFAFRWTSLLYETEWCRNAPNGRFSANTTGLKLTPGGVWLPAIFDDINYSEAPLGWIITEGHCGPKGCTVAWAIKSQRLASQGPATAFQSRLRNLDTQEVLGESGPAEVDPDGSATSIGKATMGKAIRFDLQIKHDTTFQWYKDGTIAGVGFQTA